MTEPFEEEAEVTTTEFSKSGIWIATASSGNIAHVWELPLAPLPVPAWLPELAEALAQQRLNSEGVAEPVLISEFIKLRERVLSGQENEVYTRWAKWFFGDRGMRAISPNSAVTVSEYVQQRIEENTLGSLQEAVRISPTNGLALARMALQVLKQDSTRNPRRAGEADWLTRHALELERNDAEVNNIRVAILEQLSRVKE